MIKINQNGLTYYQFEKLNEKHVKHGLFTRKGGISPHPYKSLNLGSTTGDRNDNVAANRKLIFDIMGLPVTSIFDVWQVHGNEIVDVQRPRRLDEAHHKADGIITNKPGITLFMRFADCVPILLYEPHHKVIGLVHAGWQGTVKRIVQAAVEKMQKEYRVDPQQIIAGIGPSICVEHYPVGEDVIKSVGAALPEFKDKIIYNQNQAIFFDLWKANVLLLQQIGVETIEQSEICTASNTDEWYSYRAEGVNSGRFGALITLD
jgi:YfiH family protein